MNRLVDTIDAIINAINNILERLEVLEANQPKLEKEYKYELGVPSDCVLCNYTGFEEITKIESDKLYGNPDIRVYMRGKTPFIRCRKCNLDYKYKFKFED